MTSIILILLFLLQLISFYFIALLYSKLHKIKELEKKQNQVLVEIEDSFGAYIAEMKDENNRLLQELKNTKSTIIPQVKEVFQNKINEQETSSFEQPKPYVSKKLAANSYKKTVATTEKKVPVTMKEKVLFYDEEGKTVEDIAKLLQIGKTEVELFLKFKD